MYCENERSLFIKGIKRNKRMSHERGERERAELGPQGLLIFLYMQFAVSSSTLSNGTVVLLHQKALGSTCSCAYYYFREWEESIDQCWKLLLLALWSRGAEEVGLLLDFAWWPYFSGFQNSLILCFASNLKFMDFVKWGELAGSLQTHLPSS